MKNFSFVIAATLLLMAATQTNAQELDKFKADLGKKVVMGKEVKLPYTDVVSYFGYVKPGSKPDEEKNGKKMYYLYVWVPVVAPELGIRMISPVPEKLKQNETDVITADYTANKDDKTNYFDTWISLEKAEGILAIDQVAAKASSAKWNTIDQNDDSSEMPAQPSGSKYNSLMRITSEVSNPLKAITAGLYRVGFTTYKGGEVKGGFLAQIGSPVKLPGVIISNNINDITAAKTTASK